MAAALAMAIAPMGAMAQERGQGRWGGGGPSSAQSQGAGGNAGGAWRGNRSGGGDGGSFRNRGVSSGDSRGSMRGRSFRGEAGGQPNVQSRPAWTGGARSQDNAVARARMEQAQRQQVQSAQQAQAQAQARSPSETRQSDVRRDSQQWSGRNRTYADPNRDRTYNQNWRNGNRDSGNNNWRDNNRNDSWRNDGWRNNDRSRYTQNNRAWNRDWRRDNRYDWQSYRSANRDRYRLGRYYAPYRNYSYRRVSIGFSLDTLFFGSRYWINDPWSYRLPPAYGGYRWIRYYDDALLVDTYTGEVVDVIYDFFW